jgi:nitrate/nitrite transporter NarK
LAGGFLAARLAPRKPVLHALIVSIFAAAALGVLTEPPSLRTTFWWAAVFSLGGITGAFFHQRIFAKKEH